MLNKQEHKKNLKEFRTYLTEDITQLLTGEKLSLDELAEQSHIPSAELDKISMGNYQNWGTIHQLARFFDKKIRIIFY
ncbi:MAG: hypothetical protein ACK5N8_07125 [Alphaproteobacteria bacterium]